MTFLELQNLCASYLDDLQFGYFTQAQLKVWLNGAQQEVQKRLIKCGENYYTKCAITTLVVNQSRYVLPEDFKKLNRLEIITTGVYPNESVLSLTPMTINQRDLIIQGTGQPLYYYLDKNVIQLFPCPDTALVMRMIYTYQVTDMTLDSDTPDVPNTYHRMLALLAVEDGFLKDGRIPDLIVKKIKEYDDTMATDSTERQQDTVREVVATGDNFGGGDFYY